MREKKKPTPLFTTFLLFIHRYNSAHFFKTLKIFGKHFTQSRGRATWSWIEMCILMYIPDIIEKTLKSLIIFFWE